MKRNNFPQLLDMTPSFSKSYCKNCDFIYPVKYSFPWKSDFFLSACMSCLTIMLFSPIRNLIC